MSADPRADDAGVGAVYETPAATAETTDAVGVVTAGGYGLMQLSPSAADWFVPGPGATDPQIGKPGAQEWVHALDPANSLRFTRWTEGEAVVVLLTSPEHHTPVDVRRFVDSLRPA